MKEYLTHNFSTDDFDLVSIVDELPLWSAPFGMDLLNVVKLKPDIKALDIGCGLGFPMLELAMRLGNSSKVFGIDPWERAIERVNLKIKVLGLKNAEVIKGVAEKIPFEDNYFDLIVSNNGLNNVEDLKVSLAECNRVSKKGAQLIFTFNQNNTMMEFYREFSKVLASNGLFKEIEKMKEHISLKRKPLEEIKRNLSESGYEVGFVLHNKFKMQFLDGTAMLNHYLIKYWFLPSWKEILKRKDQERIFDQLEKIFNDYANSKGYITLTIPYVTVVCIRK